MLDKFNYNINMITVCLNFFSSMHYMCCIIISIICIYTRPYYMAYSYDICIHHEHGHIVNVKDVHDSY